MPILSRIWNFAHIKVKQTYKLKPYKCWEWRLKLWKAWKPYYEAEIKMCALSQCHVQTGKLAFLKILLPAVIFIKQTHQYTVWKSSEPNCNCALVEKTLEKFFKIKTCAIFKVPFSTFHLWKRSLGTSPCKRVSQTDLKRVNNQMYRSLCCLFLVSFNWATMVRKTWHEHNSLLTVNCIYMQESEWRTCVHEHKG